MEGEPGFVGHMGGPRWSGVLWGHGGPVWTTMATWLDNTDARAQSGPLKRCRTRVTLTVGSGRTVPRWSLARPPDQRRRGRSTVINAQDDIEKAGNATVSIRMIDRSWCYSATLGPIFVYSCRVPTSMASWDGLRKYQIPTNRGKLTVTQRPSNAKQPTRKRAYILDRRWGDKLRYLH